MKVVNAESNKQPSKHKRASLWSLVKYRWNIEQIVLSFFDKASVNAFQCVKPAWMQKVQQ